MGQNLYELMFVMDVALSEDDRREITNEIEREVIDHGGEIETFEQYDVRSLAYPINDVKRGDYRLIRFESDGQQNQQLQQRLNIRDDVLRYLIIKMDQRDLNIFRESQKESKEEVSEDEAVETADESEQNASPDTSSAEEKAVEEDVEEPEPAETA